MGKKKSQKAAPEQVGSVPPAEPADAPQPRSRMSKKEYRQELAGLQIEMFRLQEWAQAKSLRLVILLEGLGPAGKRGTANRIAEGLDRRVVQVFTLDPSRKRERTMWHYQRFVEHFPKAGRIAVFDGSWYHHPAVDRALGVLSDEEFASFLRTCNEFEQTLVDTGVTLLKYWFSADDLTQEQLFRAHYEELAKQKKLNLPERKAERSPVLVAEVRDAILSKTGTAAPWYLVNSTDRRLGRLNCIAHLLSLVPRDDADPAPAEPTGDQPGFQPVREVY